MKKFLSCVLALALVFSLMSMTVFAATTTTGEEVDKLYDTPSDNNNVIGTHGGNNGIDNGIGYENFGNTSAGADITVNFNGQTSSDTNGDENGNNTSTIVNRYAIDITYAQLVIDLTDIPNEQEIVVNGQVTPVTVLYVWDVTEHMYVAQYTNNNDEIVTPDEGEPAPVNAEPITITDAFMITNHSDLAIWYAPELKLDDEKVQSMSMYYTNGNSEITTGNFMVRKATAAVLNEDGTVATDGAAAEGNYHNIVARPTTDWTVTINNMTAAAVATGDVIAALVITFSPNEMANATDYTA